MNLLIRLDTGNFAWASEATARKTRIIDVVYNACNNELVRCLNMLPNRNIMKYFHVFNPKDRIMYIVRTKTLVKNAIVVIDAAPFRQW